jgi:hypothetical protein
VLTLGTGLGIGLGLSEAPSDALVLGPEQPELGKVQPAPQPAGIFPGAAQPPASYGITVTTNQWSGYIGGQYLVVSAGSQSAHFQDGSAGDPNRSELVVFDPNGDANIFATGTDDGPLTITAESGSVLTLQAADGQDIAFNLTSDAFSRASSSTPAG